MTNGPDRRQADRRQAAEKKGGLRIIDRREWIGKDSDRRTLIRLPEQIPILLSSEEDIFREFREFAVDISGRGLQIRSSREFPIGSRVHLCIYPPDLFVPIQVQGKVEWRKLDAKNKEFVYGLSFKDLTGEYQVMLDNFLAGRTRNLSNHGGSFRDRCSKIFYQKVVGKLLSRSLIGKQAVTGRSDSGTTFDHIYGNQPKGEGVVGRMLDRVFLGLPAAKASRYRKDLIREVLQHEIKSNIAAGQMTKILDLASGTARYLIESIGASESSHVEALCIDRDKESIESGRRVAGNRPLRFLRLDIFKARRLETLSRKSGWKPNVIIVSGLIYYFSDRKVKALLSHVYEWLESGGLLILTNMIQNPNRKLIGHLFVTQGGNPWIPLARPVHLIRQWLVEAGFDTPHYVKDPWGMYSVFSAKKDKEKIKSVSFEFRSEGNLLRGKLYKPTQSRKISGMVLFIHGLGYTFASYRLTPAYFGSNGIALAMYNMAGHGNSTGQWSLESAISMVSRAIDELESRESRELPIFLFAHSTGGLIALLAAQRDARVKGAAIVNIVNSVTDSYLHWHRSGYNQRVKEYFKTNGIVPPIIESFLDDPQVMQEYQAHRRPWSDLEFPYRYGLMHATSFVPLARAICFSPNLLDFANHIDFPVLLFRGADDEVIPVDKTEQVARLLGQRGQVVKTTSTNHFQLDQWGYIQSNMLEFFRDIIFSK